MVFLKTKLGFGPKEIARYMLASGAMVMVSGVASVRSMRALGLDLHTMVGAVAGVCRGARLGFPR